jgi:DNA-binding transcriptional MerR regulator
MKEISDDEYQAMIRKIGEPSMHTREGRIYRIKKSREMRERGFSLQQIGDYLGVLPETVSKYLEEEEEFEDQEPEQ